MRILFGSHKELFLSWYVHKAFYLSNSDIYKKKNNYQQPSRKRSACSYPSVVPTAAISIVMPYDLVGHIFKIQQLHIGFPVKG